MHISGILWIPLLALFIPFIRAQTEITLLVVIEDTETPILTVISNALSTAEKAAGGNDVIKVDLKTVKLDREYVNESLNEVCSVLAGGVTITLDMTFTGWDKLRDYTLNNSIIYLRLGASIVPFLHVTDDFLMKKNATDFALIFESERELNPALYYLISESTFRLVVIDDLSKETAAKIRDMRPSPSYYVLYASTTSMDRLFKIAVEGGLVTRDDVWNLVFADMTYDNFLSKQSPKTLNVSVTVITLNQDVCCRLKQEKSGCTCTDKNLEVYNQYLEYLMTSLVTIIKDTESAGHKLTPKVIQCAVETGNGDNVDPAVKTFKDLMKSKFAAGNEIVKFEPDTNLIIMRSHFDIGTLQRDGKVEKIANWTTEDGMITMPSKMILPVKRFFRVGTAYALPWSTVKKDPVTGEVMRDANGKEIWEGYCIDFINKLASTMKFDYELVIPEDNNFGSKTAEGKWTGLVGDLVRGGKTNGHIKWIEDCPSQFK